VQLTSTRAYVERVVFYLARLYVGQLEKGNPYTLLARTIGISLVDFVLFPDLEDLHTRYRLHDEAHRLELTDVLEMHIIELAKFRRDKPRGLKTPFERWLHALKFGDFYQDSGTSLPAELKEEEGIEMALEKMRQASASEQVREMIEFRRKAEHDEATRLESARLDGLEEGRTEALQEAARSLREAGVPDEAILKATGMRPEDLD